MWALRLGKLKYPSGGRTGQHRVARNDRTRGHHSGCSGFFGDYAVYQNGPRHDAAQKTARTGHGGQCAREMAGTGTEQTQFHSGKQGVVSKCDAECDAISPDQITPSTTRHPSNACGSAFGRAIDAVASATSMATKNAVGETNSAPPCERRLAWGVKPVWAVGVSRSRHQGNHSRPEDRLV